MSHFTPIEASDERIALVSLCLSIVSWIGTLLDVTILHIMLPPIIPQFMAIVASSVTILIGFPILKERIKGWLKK